MTQQVKLAPDIASDVTFQSYSPQPVIAGVFYHKLSKHRALEGTFMEYMRVTGGTIEGLPVAFEARQISFSQAAPERINAFHLHPKMIQDELWSVVQGTLKVWLIDCRADSPTLGVRRYYMLNGEEPAFLHIPTGVAHGYRAGEQGALLVYAMNSQFNIEDPNEGRLPWDFFGKGLWEDDLG